MPRPAVITLLGVLDLLVGLPLLLGGLVVTPLAIVQGYGTTAAAAAALLGVVGLYEVVCGVGLLRLKGFGRLMQLVQSILWIPFFPAGTALAVASLMVLLRPGAKVLFSGRQEIDASEEEDVAELQASTGSAVAVAGVGLGLMVVMVPIFGIIVAIAIPNFLSAVQRSRQKQVVADLRRVAIAIESYRADRGVCPAGRSSAELVAALPGAAAVGGLDPWGHPYRYESDGAGFVLASSGKDGRFEAVELRGYAPGATTYFDCDIVYVDNGFLRYPSGLEGIATPTSTPMADLVPPPSGEGIPGAGLVESGEIAPPAMAPAEPPLPEELPLEPAPAPECSRQPRPRRGRRRVPPPGRLLRRWRRPRPPLPRPRRRRPSWTSPSPRPWSSRASIPRTRRPRSARRCRGW